MGSRHIFEDDIPRVDKLFDPEITIRDMFGSLEMKFLLPDLARLIVDVLS